MWRRLRRKREKTFDIGFFTWHARIEANHAEVTSDELTELLAEHHIDQERFIRNANLMLDAVLVFWRGLDIQRAALAAGERTHAKAG